jgi:ATP-dependent exoDNAse (exonuclease V) beta subunit
MFDGASDDPPVPAEPWAALNDEQRLAVLHGDGAAPATPLLIIAGAGSGKTSTLAHRLARLVRDGADPQRILLLTFSRRAAQALERRAGQVLQRVQALRGVEAPRCRGRGRSMASARGSCANTPSASASRRRSRSTTVATPRT